MALFFITGIAGSGKSTVCDELVKLGVEAHDADLFMSRWRNKHTGYIHPKSSIKSYDRTEKFLEEHDWVLPRSSVEPIALEASDRDIFIGGAIGNEHELINLFAAVFALSVDESTLAHRLQTRTNNSWGKQPHELAMTLNWQKEAEASYRRNGYEIVDATQSIDKVAATILDKRASIC